MTLQVPFEGFAEAVGRVIGAKAAYVTVHPLGALATACDPARQLVVAALAALTPEAARTALTTAGMHVFEGVWSVDGEIEVGHLELEETHVAAVAYRTAGREPGLWVDAFPAPPTSVQALRAMYEEFRGTGEVADVTFEEFVRLAEPNVVVLTPDQLRGFAQTRRRPCD